MPASLRQKSILAAMSVSKLTHKPFLIGVSTTSSTITVLVFKAILSVCKNGLSGCHKRSLPLVVRPSISFVRGVTSFPGSGPTGQASLAVCRATSHLLVLCQRQSRHMQDGLLHEPGLWWTQSSGDDTQDERTQSFLESGLLRHVYLSEMLFPARSCIRFLT